MKNSILFSGSALVILSTVSKLMGFAREQAFASALGASQLSDAFVLAQFITGLVFGIPSALLTNAFLPIYSAYRARGESERAALFARTVTRISVIACVALAVVGAAASPLLVRFAAPGLASESTTLAAQLTAVLFPATAATTLVALFTAALNSHGSFLLPALHPIVQNTFGIIGVVFFTKQYSVWGITYGWLVGAVIGFLVQLPVLFRSTPALSGGRVDFGDESIKTMLKMSGPLVLASLSGQVYGLVDKGLASGLQSGSMTALNYAARIVQLPVSVIVTAVCTVMFPRLSECWGRRDTEAMGDLLSRSITVVSMLVIPAAVAFGTLSGPIVRIVYQRGAFTETAVSLTASSMLAYSVGVVLQSLILLLQRTAFSMQDSVTPLVGSVLGNVVAIPLAYVLVPGFAHVGLALANTAGFVATMAVMVVVILRRLKTMPICRLAVDHVRIAAAAAVMAIATRATLVCLPIRGGDAGSAMRFLALAGIGILVYCVGLISTGVLPIGSMVRTVRQLAAGRAAKKA